MNVSCENTDLIVFSHLRWDNFSPRSHQFISRYSKHRRVFYVEEPMFGITDEPRLHIKRVDHNTEVIVPHLPANFTSEEIELSMRSLVNELIQCESITDFTSIYHTPMPHSYTRHLSPSCTIFDCFDEAFLLKEIPDTLQKKELELLKFADIVFTSGQPLYQAKKNLHPNVHYLPTSTDYEHFLKCRANPDEPLDQMKIPHPRIGFYGNIDERIDFELLVKMADLRPDFHFILIGPVVNLDPTFLPGRWNIHYLGRKDYHALPGYIASWDCAMLPYTLNETTFSLSISKIPEFLAAGKPIVSTSLKGIAKADTDSGLVKLADQPSRFIESIEMSMNERTYDQSWSEKADRFLESHSWEMVFAKMAEKENELKTKKNVLPPFSRQFTFSENVSMS